MMGLYAVLFARIVSRNGDVYALKVVTLAISFAAGMVVAIFSIHEFGYDTGHENDERIFRVLAHNTDKNFSGNRLSASITRTGIRSIGDEIGDSVVISRVKALKKITVVDHFNQPVYDQKIHAADPAIKNVFSFDIAAGDIDQFTNTGDVVAMVSRRAVPKYFGDQEAVGSSLQIVTFGDTVIVGVVAVFNAFPSNTHDDFDFIINYDSSALAALCFDPDQSGVYGRRLSHKGPLSLAGSGHGASDYLLQPIEEIYFGPRVLAEEARHGDLYSVAILICIASLIFLLAICSFANLSLITLPARSREIAVKKLAGTTQRHLLTQFLCESLALTGASWMIAIMILASASRYVEGMLGTGIAQMARGSSSTLIVIIVVMVFVVATAPVILATRFFRAGPTRLLGTDTIAFPGFRRLITVVQFGVSIFLIVSSTVVRRQINYSLIKEPGWNHEQIVYMVSPENIPDSAVHKIKAGWPDINPRLIDAVAVSQLPNQLKGKEAGSDLFVLEADYNFKDFFKLSMVEGDWFEYTDRDSVFVVNRTGLKKMPGFDHHLIGVVQDFGSAFNQPEPPVKVRNAKNTTHNWICFRVDEVDIRSTVRWIERRMHRKGSRGKAHYLDENFEKWLIYQDHLNALSGILTIISALLAGCAIYGLTVSLVRDKVRQIAVHHLFGARPLDVIRLLARGLFRQLAMAVILFGPATYILLNELLRTFVYAAGFSWLDPLCPLGYCATVIIGLCTWQALGLYRTDLVSSLKNEQ